MATAAALPHGAAGAFTPAAARGPTEGVIGEPESYTPAASATVLPARQRARKAPLLPLDEAGSAVPPGAAAAMFSAARLGSTPSSATTSAGMLPGLPGGSSPRAARAAAPSLGVAGPPALLPRDPRTSNAAQKRLVARRRGLCREVSSPLPPHPRLWRHRSLSTFRNVLHLQLQCSPHFLLPQLAWQNRLRGSPR